MWDLSAVTLLKLHETQQSDDYHKHDLKDNGQNLFCTRSIVNIHQSLQTDFLFQILLTINFFLLCTHTVFFFFSLNEGLLLMLQVHLG